MATHIHEEEQVEALKRWWKENGTSIVAGVILGLAGIFGWNAWQNHQRVQAEQAASLYAQLLDAVESRQYPLAEGLVQRLTSEFGSTAYADFARLLAAKAAVEQNDLEKAKKYLGQLVTAGEDENFRHIARLRLARVHLAAGHPEDGLKLLDSADVGDPGGFVGQYEELKGDLYVALGQLQQAATAYQKAIELGRDDAYLKMKLNDLGLESS
ncbi:MAG TPA: tetratricopeptide repeat protein [Methylothermaceae bacterium]|nr:tetratricopeptide repeat protein [Methylothermaceae bacterium]